MDADELRALQSPLKARYREQPGAALITLRARGSLGAEAVACKVETGRALATAGLHPATGGDGSLACSGDMLLEALVACAGVTLRAVATSLSIPIPGSRNDQLSSSTTPSCGCRAYVPLRTTGSRCVETSGRAKPVRRTSAALGWKFTSTSKRSWPSSRS